MMILIMNIINQILMLFSNVMVMKVIFNIKTKENMYILVAFIVSVSAVYVIPMHALLFGLLGLLCQISYLYIVIENKKRMRIIYIFITIFIDAIFHLIIELGYGQLMGSVESNMLVVRCITSIVLIILPAIINWKKGVVFEQGKGNVIFVFLLFAIITSYFMIFMLDDSITIINSSFKITLLISVIVTTVSIFIVVHHYLKKEKENEKYVKEIELKEEIVNLQEKYINEVIESYKEIRIFKHDIKGHLQAINKLLLNDKKEEALKYIENMEEEVKSGKVDICSNIYIAGVLHLFLDIMKEKNIVFNFEYEVFQEIKVKNMHLSSMFYNLLSNAVEAVNKAEHKEIGLLIKKAQYALIIEIRNCVHEEFSLSQLENGETTKEDKENHGLGLLSIKKIVDAYNGTISYRLEDTVLQTSIVLFDVFNEN